LAVSAAAARVNRVFADAWLWGGVAAYAVLYFVLGTIRYAAHANYVDLGIFSQTAVSAFGCFCNAIEGSHWAFHFSPVLYLAGILIRIWRSPLSLVALQAVAGALTIPAVYGLVIRRADRATARLAAAVVWLYPPLAGAIFNDFHENGLAPTAITWLLWAFDGGYAGWTILFALIALSVKEDQALFIAIAGVLGAIAYRRDARRARLAVGVAALAAITFALYFAVIQPHAAANAAWAPTRFYAWSAEDWAALFPAGVLQRIGFLVLAFLPLLFVPFRTPAFLVAIAPLGEVLASRMSTTFTMGSHYAGAWAGWALYAFAVALGPRAQRALYWCIALCVVEFAVANPLHPGTFLHARTQRDATLDRFLQTLPRNASIATQEEAFTHLAAINANATLLPETPDRPVTACYVLIDTDYPNSARLQEAQALVRRLYETGRYALIEREDGISLYRRYTGCR
jgi:uncharacterized membrane protein